MMETEQGGSGSVRHISAQSAQEFLATICKELLDWGAIALNSAGRLLTALLNFVMLAIAAVIAVLAVLVLILREQITKKPSEDATFSLIGVKELLRKTRASVSEQ
jgi:large-conductance mechanosensitive channel